MAFAVAEDLVEGGVVAQALEVVRVEASGASGEQRRRDRAEALAGLVVAEDFYLGLFIGAVVYPDEAEEDAAVGLREVSVLTVIDGGAIGLFHGIESLSEAMPGRVSHGRLRVKALRCGPSGDRSSCPPRRAGMAVSKLTAPGRSLDEVTRWRPGARWRRFPGSVPWNC